MLFVWPPTAALAGLSFFLGITMLVSGIVDFLIFAGCHRYMAGAGWFLVDGVLTILLSIFLLCDQRFTALTIPFIFGMWLFCTGVSKFANFFELLIGCHGARRIFRTNSEQILVHSYFGKIGDSVAPQRINGFLMR